jgi:copper transport protein
LLAKRALMRFSTMATVCVAGVVGAGVLLSISQVGSVENLFGTPFGLAVVGKVCLVAPMVVLGAHNRFRSIPRLPQPESVVAAASRIARNVRIEAALACAVLVLAGMLTTLVPATSIAAPPGEPPQFFLSQTVRDNDRGVALAVQLQVYPPPGGPGIYIISILLTDPDTGALFLNTTNATIYFHKDPLPVQVGQMFGPHDNHYFLETGALSEPGRWRLELAVTLTDGSELVANFNVNVRDAVASDA